MAAFKQISHRCKSDGIVFVQKHLSFSCLNYENLQSTRDSWFLYSLFLLRQCILEKESVLLNIWYLWPSLSCAFSRRLSSFYALPRQHNFSHDRHRRWNTSLVMLKPVSVLLVVFRLLLSSGVKHLLSPMWNVCVASHLSPNHRK